MRDEGTTEKEALPVRRDGHWFVGQKEPRVVTNTNDVTLSQVYCRRKKLLTPLSVLAAAFSSAVKVSLCTEKIK